MVTGRFLLYIPPNKVLAEINYFSFVLCVATEKEEDKSQEDIILEKKEEEEEKGSTFIPPSV